MDIVRLHTISVALHSSSYLLIPVTIESGDPSDNRASWTRHRGALTQAQGDVLFRYAEASLAVAEQVRALAHGIFSDADLGGEAGDSLPSDDIVSRVGWGATRCTGGRVYWW
jgi:hypothetical protein